jgi:hypothetical protein
VKEQFSEESNEHGERYPFSSYSILNIKEIQNSLNFFGQGEMEECF